MYRAVRLGYPNVQAQFRTTLKNSTGDVVDSRIFTTDLNKGSCNMLIIKLLRSMIYDGRHCSGLVHDPTFVQPRSSLCVDPWLVCDTS